MRNNRTLYTFVYKRTYIYIYYKRYVFISVYVYIDISLYMSGCVLSALQSPADDLVIN